MVFTIQGLDGFNEPASEPGLMYSCNKQIILIFIIITVIIVISPSLTIIIIIVVVVIINIMILIVIINIIIIITPTFLLRMLIAWQVLSILLLLRAANSQLDIGTSQ